MKREVTEAELDGIEPHLRELYVWRGEDKWVLGHAVRTVSRDDKDAILRYLPALAAGAVRVTR